MIKLFNGDCLQELKKIDTSNKILVIDPPFNIGYHYKTYKDKLKEEEYLNWIKNIVTKFDRFVIVHYPEMMFKISIALGIAPNRVTQWVYNSNTKRQYRSVAYFGFDPDFSLVKQPYKNPNDKRIKALIEKGSKGTNIYDWWNVNQVKNVSKEKTAHPCQMPLEIMKNIIGIIPGEDTIVDCFLGSGTTGVACEELERNFIGIELDEFYFNIARDRIGD